MKKKIDFIIVGAMKAGTSSLAFHIANHPSVCMPRKEVHFFDNDKNFNKGTDWYNLSVQRKGCTPTMLYGEKTPTYSYDPKVAKRIYDAFPDVKLIWIFRDPVKRAYSNYLHAYSSGYDNLSFEEAIKQEEVRIKQDIWLGYKHRSLYHEQVENYLQYFDKEQMFFCIFEEFIYDPIVELRKIFDFLGISIKDFEFKQESKNKTVIPRFPKMLWYTRKILDRHSILFNTILKLNQIGVSAGYPKLSMEIHNELSDYFFESNRKLETLIEKDLTLWETIKK